MSSHSLKATAFLVIASLIALGSVWRDAPIVDEIPHIGAGYSYIAGHTAKFNPEHPPLVKDVAGLALLPLGIDPAIMRATYTGEWPSDVNGQWNFGRSLIYHSGTNPIKIVRAAKIPMLVFFILSGWLIYAWAKKTFSPRAVLLAVFLFAFSPTVIAHSRFVTTDIAALFGVLFATYFFLRYLERQTNNSFWLAAIAFGVALLTKFSTFLLAPYFILLAIAWAWADHRHFVVPSARLIAKTVLVMATGFIVVVGPVYQLHVLKYPPEQQKADAIAVVGQYKVPILTDLVIWASDKPVLRPYAQYGLGLAMVFQRAEGGNRTYFLGEFSNSSFRSYFPVVYVLKEPIPLLILLLCALWLGFRTATKDRNGIKNHLRSRFPQYTMLLWIIIYMASSVSSNLNIGVRHLMPIYGFIFVLVAGAIMQAHIYRKKWFRIFVFVLCGWYISEFVSVYPYYLTYFNQFAGGPSGGHRYVVDSNLDWGQDLWRLADFVKDKNIRRIYVDYFGWADQEFYLGDAFVWMQGGTYRSKEQFLRDNPQGGWLAVSASYYQESSVTSKIYAWLPEPTAVIGNSIFVWRVAP